jgi:hypothetical protein
MKQKDISYYLSKVGKHDYVMSVICKLEQGNWQLHSKVRWEMIVVGVEMALVQYTAIFSIHIYYPTSVL